MPHFELLVIIKRMSKANLINTCKRLGEDLIDKDAILRKIEFLGVKTLPYKIYNSHTPGKAFDSGNFLLYHFDAPPTVTDELLERYKLDTDIIRSIFHNKALRRIDENYVCTLENEMQPPVYRESVQKLIANKKEEVDRFAPPPENYEI